MNIDMGFATIGVYVTCYSAGGGDNINYVFPYITMLFDW